jgi:hypothetical protein
MSRPIIWTPIWDARRQGLENLLLEEGSADSVVLAFDEHGQPFRLAYHLTWDPAWRLQTARLLVTSGDGTQTLALETDGAGRWRDERGQTLPALDGCLDIDIWPTPFTNTFPLRREPLALGERREFRMAWVAAPALSVRPMRQGYTRLDTRRYLYENLEGSGFRAELLVDDDGVVVDYEGVFRRVL